MHNIVVAGLVALAPGGFVAWVVAGLLAGWLAGLVVRGRGFGCLGDIVLGVVGALIGGFVVTLLPVSLNLPSAYGFWGTVVVAFLGALILAALGRLIGGSGRKSPRRYSGRY